MNEPKDVRQMTADSVGRDLLQGLILELKLLPEPWPKLSKTKQDDIIDRLAARVERLVGMAVHVLSSQGRVVVAGELDQITIKDGVKAVIKFASNAANLHQLYEYAGQAVLVVVADAEQHTQGMDEIEGEADQRAMDLGHEYHDNDGGGMGGQTVDGQARALPSPSDDPDFEEVA